MVPSESKNANEIVSPLTSPNDTTKIRIAQRYGFVKRCGENEKAGGDAPTEANKEEERA